MADFRASPLTLARHLDSSTGREWRGWEPEALIHYLAISDDNVAARDMALATQVACTNPDSFTDWPLFVHLNSAFNGRRANFEHMDVPESYEAAWTCTVLRALQPSMSFGPGVLRFLTALCLDNGLAYFPWTVDSPLFATDGLVTAEQPWSEGLVAPFPRLKDLKAVIAAGGLDVKPEDVDLTDPFLAQLNKLLAIASYVADQQKVAT